MSLNSKKSQFVEVKDKDLNKEIVEGVASNEELAKYFLDHYSASSIANALAELWITIESYQPTQIPVSELDYYRIMGLFRIKGQKADGTEETRGRKKKVQDIPITED